MGNATDTFFQLVLFFAGILLGVVVPLFKKNIQKRAAVILAVIFFSSSLAWMFYEIGKNQAMRTGEATRTFDATQMAVTAPPTLSPIVLEPTWIGLNKPVLIFSNQVIVQAITAYTAPGYDELDYAGVKVILPDDVVENRYLKRGERVFFSYQSSSYSVTILDIRSTEIQISAEEVLEQNNE